jgi:CHASE2 domain-containing sensor protein
MQQRSGQSAFRLPAPPGITGAMTAPPSLSFRAFCLIAALLLAGIAFWFARGSLTSRPELRAWDTLFRLRGRLPVRPDFVIVAGDLKSIQALGQPPWPRRVYADVVRAVHRAGPKAIVLDRFFEERDTIRPGSDAALWKAIADARDVFLPVVHGNPDRRQITRDDLRGLVALEKSTVTLRFTRLNTTPDYAWLGFDPPVSDFAVSARGMGISTVDETADQDGVIRRTRVGWVSPIQYPAQPPLPEPSSLSGQTGVVPSLPVIAAMFAFNVDKEALAYTFGEHLIIGGSLNPPVLIPIDATGHITMNYVGPAGTIPRYSFVDVGRGQVDASVFKEKVVLIGLTDGPPEEAEPLATPFGLMPRVEITANALHSILERNYLFIETERSPLGYLMAFGLTLGFFVPIFRRGIDLLVTLLLLLVYVAVAVMALRFWHTLLPVLPAVLLALLFYAILFLTRLILESRRGTVAG